MLKKPARKHVLSSRPVALCQALERRILFAFGVTQTTGGSASYVIDNGGDLRFSVLRQGASVTSTIHIGDVASIKYKGQEMLAPYSTTSRYSHYEQGLGSITNVTTTTGGAPGSRWILVTCDDSAESSGAVIQYYAVRENDNNIYMASLPLDVTNGPGEGRFIAYLERGVFSNPEAPSDNNGTTGAIEGSDVFGHADGTTSSKFYNMGREMIDNVYHGLTGVAGGSTVGAWMFMGNREHSAGGPFFKDIDFQAGSAVEIYNCIFTGHTQTEPYRQGLHVYSFQFTNGSLPTTPDYSWLETLKDGNGDLLIRGLIPAGGRGTLTGVASGVPVGHDVVVGLSNSAAQYWTRPDAAGNYTISGVQPGTYTETLYQDQLEVGTKTVTITAGATTTANIVDSFYIPSNPIFRIGTWDGKPVGFLNADKIETMHPSDVRMSPWVSGNFVVGTNTDAQWPTIQFMGVNNSQRITFTLTSAQVQAMTLRIGITLGFEGGRPKITVNSGQTGSWTSANPSASRDLNSRGITRGTWRGDNQLYTYSIPSSAFHAGTNTIDLAIISGSYVAGQTWLSPNVVYDAIDLVPTTTASQPAIASVTITPGSSSVGVAGTRTFTAVAKDSAGNVLPANFDWSATRGTIDPSGNYVASDTPGGGIITATAILTRTDGYSVTSSSSSSRSSTATLTGNTGVTVVAGAISGIVFEDLDAGAAYDPGETAVGGVQVYLDTNGNGAFDGGEPAVTTGANGAYVFSNLSAGSYTVRHIAPAGFVAGDVAGVTVGGGSNPAANLPLFRTSFPGGAAAESFTLRKNTAGQYEILVGGGLAYTLPATLAAPLTFNLGDGDDTLTLDFAGGAPVPAGGVSTDAETILVPYTGATPVATIRQLLADGRLAMSTASAGRRFGYFDDGSVVLIEPTLDGDANLDGVIGPDDYALADRGARQGGAYWWEGDFNYDGVVDAADYGLLNGPSAPVAEPVLVSVASPAIAAAESAVPPQKKKPVKPSAKNRAARAHVKAKPHHVAPPLRHLLSILIRRR